MDNSIKVFKDSFLKLYDSVDVNEAQSLVKSSNFSESFESAVLDESSLSLYPIDKEYLIQRPIREWFGKDDINRNPIGAHPDFKYLSQTKNVEYHYITTMFVDIKNSTRLALLYDLKTVRHIKNTILCCASEIVRAMDGYVHRFMGDALMAYFGGKNQSAEDATMAAISCAAMLQILMKESVIPSLKKLDIDPSYIGFRIGIDFGSDNDVLWSSYGYTDVHEVTATSLYVDRASKLQSIASKDSVMLGANLIKFIDLSEKFMKVKTKVKNGVIENIEYLKPDLTDINNQPCHYRILQLNSDAFYKILPLPVELKTALNLSSIVSRLNGVSYYANVEENGDWTWYPSLSRCISKERKIRFWLRIPKHILDGFRLPIKGRFIRKNYGVEASDANCLEPDIKEFTISTNSKDFTDYFERNTAYRGLHTVALEIKDFSNELIFRDIIGVHIE